MESQKGEQAIMIIELYLEYGDREVDNRLIQRLIYLYETKDGTPIQELNLHGYEVKAYRELLTSENAIYKFILAPLTTALAECKSLAESFS
jgi:hypothetical protein